MTKEKKKKIYVPLTEEEAITLWLGLRDAGDQKLQDTVAIALITQEVELPTADTEALVEFYLPWLVKQGLVAEGTSLQDAKGKVLQFTSSVH